MLCWLERPDGVPLRRLYIANTLVQDLSPLKGTSLYTLWCSSTKVKDLSPLKDIQVVVLSRGA
jgi:hypothetical protein